MSYIPKFYYLPRNEWPEGSKVFEEGENYWTVQSDNINSNKEYETETQNQLTIEHLNSDEQKRQYLLKKIMGILNKITPDRFKTLMEVMKSESVDVKMLAETLFSKILVDEMYLELYVKLCKEIMTELSVENGIYFKEIIAYLCETGVDNLLVFTDEDFCNIQEDKRFLFRRRLMTMMRFIGEMSSTKDPLFSHKYVCKIAELLLAKKDGIHAEALYFLMFTCSLRNPKIVWTDKLKNGVSQISKSYGKKEGRIINEGVQLEIKNLFLKLQDLMKGTLKKSFYYRWTEGTGNSIVYKFNRKKEKKNSSISSPILIGIFPDSNFENSMNILMSLNVFLKTNVKWDIIQRCDYGTSVQLKFRVDEISFGKLQHCNFKVPYKLSTLYLKQLDKSLNKFLPKNPLLSKENKFICSDSTKDLALMPSSLTGSENFANSDTDQLAATIYLKPIGVRIDKYGFSLHEPNNYSKIDSVFNNHARPYYKGQRFPVVSPEAVAFFGTFPVDKSKKTFDILCHFVYSNHVLTCGKLKIIDILFFENYNYKALITFVGNIDLINCLRNVNFLVDYGFNKIHLWPFNNSWQEEITRLNIYTQSNTILIRRSKQRYYDFDLRQGGIDIAVFKKKREEKLNANKFRPQIENNASLFASSNKFGLFFSSKIRVMEKQEIISPNQKMFQLISEERKKLNKIKIQNRMKIDTSYIDCLSPREKNQLREGRQSFKNKLKTDVFDKIRKILQGPYCNSYYNIALVCLGSQCSIAKISFREIKCYVNKISKNINNFSCLMHRFKELTMLSFNNFDNFNWFTSNVNCEVSTLRKTPLKFVCVDLENYQDTFLLWIVANCDSFRGNELFGFNKELLLEMVSQSNNNLSVSHWEIIEISTTSSVHTYRFEITALIDFKSVKVIESLHYRLKIGCNEAEAMVSQLPYSINWRKKYNMSLSKKKHIRRRCSQRSRRAYKTGIVNLVLSGKDSSNNSKLKINKKTENITLPKKNRSKAKNEIKYLCLKKPTNKSVIDNPISNNLPYNEVLKLSIQKSKTDNETIMDSNLSSKPPLDNNPQSIEGTNPNSTKSSINLFKKSTNKGSPQVKTTNNKKKKKK